MLIRICVTCDRYVDKASTTGNRLAQAVTERLMLDPKIGASVLRVACLNGCKNSCQVILTGREPVRLGGLKPDDAAFIVELAAIYCSGRAVLGMLPDRLRESAQP